MSRVFDALQEAARRFSGTSGAPGEAAVWKELGIGPAASPKAEGVGAKREAPAADEVLEALLAEPSFDDGPQPSISHREPQSQMLLDKSARLIPHSLDPTVVERYRMLRTKLLQERERKFFRSLVITSPSPQEGKTLTVTNLALSFAALPSFRLLVVDGDMRKGTLGNWLGIDPGQPGLSNLIEGSARPEEVLLASDVLPLHIIPRGNAQVADLQPSHFGMHFRGLIEQFDLVLVDSSPANVITDVQILAASCDAVLLVARAFSTTFKSLEECAAKLQPFRLIGTVLNAATSRRSRKYHGYY